jgi:hypothetical protein
VSTALWGPLVTVGDVRRAMESTLQLWLPATLAEVARRQGVEPRDVKVPVTWLRLGDPDDFPMDQLPGVLITSPGVTGTPARDENGRWSATWQVFVTVLARETSFERVADLVGLYTAAVRLAVLQNRSLGGFASGCRWVGEDYVPGGRDRKTRRTLGAGLKVFDVDVDDVADDTAGPLLPPDDPYIEPGEPPTAVDTELDVHRIH